MKLYWRCRSGIHRGADQVLFLNKADTFHRHTGVGGRARAHRDCQPEAAATDRAERSGCPAGSAPVMACRRTVSNGAVAVRLAAPAAAPDSSCRHAEPRGAVAAAPRTAAREVPDTRQATASPHWLRSSASRRTSRWKAANLHRGRQHRHICIRISRSGPVVTLQG